MYVLWQEYAFRIVDNLHFLCLNMLCSSEVEAYDIRMMSLCANSLCFCQLKCKCDDWLKYFACSAIKPLSLERVVMHV